MTYPETPKLLPCAHCGSTDVHLVRMCMPEDEGIRIGWRCECYECGIQTQVFEEEVNCDDLDDYTLAHVAMDDAIYCAVHSWNTRA